MGLCKTPREIALMRAAGRLNACAMRTMAEAIKPGVTTRQLDTIAKRVIESGGGVPLFYGYHGYSANICASVNSCVVHGIPNDTPLQEGDIVSIDVGTSLQGWGADMAKTFAVGRISKAAQDLISGTEAGFAAGLAQMRPGNRVGDIGAAVQKSAEDMGYGVVRVLTGHGIGRKMHEEPSLPNFGTAGRGMTLKAGMTLALEPMITQGTWRVETRADGWAVHTADGKLAAHYEHTVLITPNGPELLTVEDEAIN